MVEVIKMSFFGNSNIGIYAYANDKILLLPPGLGVDDVEEMTRVLGVIAVETRLAGTVLNGVLVAGNNNAIILPRIVFDDELEYLNRVIRDHGLDLEVIVSSSRYTALGNLFLCNDKGCIVSPLIEDKEIKRLIDSLGVEMYKARLVNIDIPGGVAVVSNTGGVIHPDAGEDDLRIVREVVKVSVEHVTVNGGIPYVKSGLVVNNKGVIVGGNTTGPELLRIRIGFGGGVVE